MSDFVDSLPPKITTSLKNLESYTHGYSISVCKWKLLEHSMLILSINENDALEFTEVISKQMLD